MTGTIRWGRPLYADNSTRFRSTSTSRTSSGVALHSKLEISALTMTLLPEPVAPAISRCGILARSAARACPATSRPRAKVSLEAARRSTSSRIRRRATMLKSLFGISIPTTLLPGIGASMRIVRAARAIARSSERASIRLTLISGDGSTSYWVTTGPAFHVTTRAGMLKLDSLAPMIAAFRSWSMPLSPTRGAMSSRRASGGRWYSVRGLSAAPTAPPASLDCPGASNPGRPARIAAPSRMDTRSRPEGSPTTPPREVEFSRSGPPSCGAAPARNGGAKVCDVKPGLGMAAGMVGGRSSPNRPDPAGATSLAAFSGRSTLPGLEAPPGVAPGAGLTREAIAREARLPSGATAAGNDMSSASRTPAIMSSVRMAPAPGAVRSGDRKWARARPMYPAAGHLPQLPSSRPKRPSSDP